MKIRLFLLTVTLFLCYSCKKNNTGPQTIVSVYAGMGSPGYMDGGLLSTQFDAPIGLTLDGSGNLYIADFLNNVIREVPTDGIVSTFAGNGIQGENNGVADSATFSNPAGILIDNASGNVYVADQLTNIIRKISPSGIVSTYAGSGVAGYLDGAALSAQFNLEINTPVGMAIDPSGNLYLADQQNNVIRKITPTGSVSTFAGDGKRGYMNGPALSAEFIFPTGIALDRSGNLYVVDQYNNAIREITPAGIVSTFAGSGTHGYKNGPALSAEFNAPTGITIDKSGNLYIADQQNNVIRKITPDGEVSTFAGNGIQGYRDGAALSSEFNYPSQIAIDPSGNFFVTDQQNNLIREISIP